MSTVRDIAQKANVSIATVSRVLSNKKNVNESTRLLVLHAAQELDYDIQAPVKNMMVSRFVPVLIRQNASELTQSGRMGESFEQTVWAGIETIFAQKKVLTKLQITAMTPQDAQHFAAEPGVAGLIILGGIDPNDFLLRLKELKTRFVIVGSHAHPLNLNSVMADVQDGTRQIAKYLVSKGRTRIAFINGPATTKTSEAKLDGLRLELGNHGLTLDSNAVIPSDFSPETGYQSTQELLQNSRNFDAVVYADDMIAIGGMRALADAGLRIPQDVAVTGFGNYDLAKYTSPTLTTINYDMHTMGKIAALRLYQMLQENDEHPWEIQVPTTLVIRESA